jgi:hypothetical protein
MSKRLPYYQSEPAEYLSGNIMNCTYEAQGVFAIISALYWQRDCALNLPMTIRRIPNSEPFIQELIDEKIIKIDSGAITVNFLKEQHDKASVTKQLHSKNGKKGADKRWGNNSQTIAKPFLNDSEDDSKTIALREDKIREDKIREDKIRVEKIKKNKTLLSEIEISDVQESLKTFFEIAKFFQGIIITNLREKEAPTTHQEKATFDGYVTPIRLMFEKKECTIDDLRDVAIYLKSPQSEFWKKNIQSTESLRKNITRLIMEAREPNKITQKQNQNDILNQASRAARTYNPSI